MRDGSTLIREKLRDTRGCVWEERQLSAGACGGSVAAHAIMSTVLGLIAGFFVSPVMPNVLIAGGIYLFAVFTQAHAFARHWIFYSTSAPAVLVPGLVLRQRLTARLTCSVLFFPIGAFRGALCALRYPGDALRAWSSYLCEGEHERPTPGVFRSPAGDIVTRLGLFYLTGACAGTFVLRSPLIPLAFELRAHDAVTALLVLAPFALCLIVPVLLLSPCFPELRRIEHSCFERAVQLKCSPNAIEAVSIYFGRLLADGSPLLVPLSLVLKNIYMRGIPGSGKTTAICYLIELFLARMLCRFLHAFDLKNKNSGEVREAARAGAERGGYVFLWFTLDVTRASHTFNLFKQRFWREMTPDQKASFLGKALGSTHGLDGYGPKFFGGNAWTMLAICFIHYEINNWHELLEKLLHIYSHPALYGLPAPTAKSATEVIEDVRHLTFLPQLNTPESSIDLADPNPTAVYWTFPGAYDTAGAVARLVLFALFESMDNAVEKPSTYVFIDEFQRVLGSQLDLVFQQSREKCALILSNQGLGDLVTREKDYRPLIGNCCDIHWIFNTSDQEEQLFLSETSGKVTRVRRTTGYAQDSEGRLVTSESFSEYEANRYGFNEMSLVNADPRISLIRFTQDEGFIQFGALIQFIIHEPHITYEEYTRRQYAPPPGDAPGTIRPGIPEPLGPPQPKLKAPREPDIINPDAQRLSRRERRRRSLPPSPTPPPV